jgi:GalNAc-alpha-(1->4)-GalNAc-alpha-(1->3)-diNAcBac-PP-undecaprenol alpha-1,4-N-acetyl-D-galactosaminyltransferase
MNQGKKRICLIAPSLQMGGIERAMSTLANYFVTLDYEIHYITLFPFEAFFELDKRIILHRPPYTFPRFGRNHFQTTTYYLKMLSPVFGYIFKQVKRIKPDAILCFGDVFPHLVMIQLSVLKTPIFYSNRSNPNIQYNSLITTIRAIAYTFTPPAGIIAQTKEAMLRKQKILGNKVPIKIIPNPVRKIEPKEFEKENWIVSVGRLHLEKGFVRLMEAFSKIDEKGWKLVLAGGGKHEIEIKQKAIELGIVEKVIFLGKVSNVDDVLLKSKIFVLSSYAEGYPNALCEAMSAGLACISFDIVAGPKDIIVDGENGFLIPDNDIHALSDKIKLLIDNPATIVRLGNKARNISESNSIELIGNELLNFILEKK